MLSAKKQQLEETAQKKAIYEEQKRKEAEERERCLAEKYAPVLQMDEKEPFGIVGVGYTLYENTKRSASCTRTIDPAQYGAEYCIERKS